MRWCIVCADNGDMQGITWLLSWDYTKWLEICYKLLNLAAGRQCFAGFQESRQKSVDAATSYLPDAFRHGCTPERKGTAFSPDETGTQTQHGVL